MNYANAFKCSDCPESNGAKGCPGWWEFVATDTGSGREELKRMCGLQALPQFLIEVIKASNRPAAAVESTRNEMAEGLGRLTEAMAMIAKRQMIAAPLPRSDYVKLQTPPPAELDGPR